MFAGVVATAVNGKRSGEYNGMVPVRHFPGYCGCPVVLLPDRVDLLGKEVRRMKWCWYDEEYPEEGSVGPFASREEAEEHARETQGVGFRVARSGEDE